MKNIMGLDVSTSNVGISLFSAEGKLLELNHVSPIIKKFEGIQQQELFLKASEVVNYIYANYNDDFEEIVIEEPLFSSAQLTTAALLNYYAGLFFGLLKQKYPTKKVTYITVDQARRVGLPELLGGKKNTLFGGLTEKYKHYGDFKKLAIVSLVAQKFPDVVWMMNNNLNLDKKNFDRADSVVVVLAHKTDWNITTANIDIVSRTLDFFIEYEKIQKTFVGNHEEKNKQKYNYLKSNNIHELLNIAI